jgi:hypothetical protein
MDPTLASQVFNPSVRLLWCLRCMVVVQCVGYVIQLDWPSSLNSWLLDSMGDPFVEELDSVIAGFLWVSIVALPILGLIMPIGGHGKPWFSSCDAALLGFVASWALTEAVFSWLSNVGNPFHATDPYGHAVRYTAPFVLFALCNGRTKHISLEWILRVAVAGTFVGHGMGAWMIHFEFVDLILGSMDTFLGEDWEVAEEREVFAKASLPWIAVQDFVLAGLILLPKRLRWVALWMAFWGFVTALSRMTAFGWERWPDFCLRIGNGGIPLLLWSHWRNLFKNRSL